MRSPPGCLEFRPLADVLGELRFQASKRDTGRFGRSTPVPFSSPDAFSTLSLVLDTRDHDESLAGSQWLIDLLADGVSQHQFIFTDGNPDIGGINLGSFTLPGSTDLAGLVDYFQLIEIPTSTFQVGVPIAIPEPSSFAVLMMAGAFTLRRRRR